MNRKRSLVTICLVITLVSVVVLVTQVFERGDKSLQKDLRTASLFPHPGQKIGEFVLTDNNGQSFDQSKLKNEWSLFFFGFSYCPDVCPTELMLLSSVKRKLNIGTLPQVYFVSLDPMRDTPTQLKNYVKHFDKDFVGLTSDLSELKSFVKPFWVYFEYAYDDDDGDYIIVKDASQIPVDKQKSYLVNHSSRIYLVSPEGLIVASFSAPHESQDLVHDIALIMEER